MNRQIPEGRKFHAFSRFFFLLLISPLFFVLHGFFENYEFILFRNILLPLGFYFLGNIVIASLLYWFFLNWEKSAIAAAWICCINFLYGFIHDELRAISGPGFLHSYTFALSLVFLIIAISLWALKKRRETRRLVRYIFSLFGILLLYDIAVFVRKVNELPKEPASMVNQVNGRRPDIYFIVLDEYAGDMQMTKTFGKDPGAFADSLAKLGFFIPLSSRAQYSITPFSMASILNMQPNDWDHLDYSRASIQYCQEQIGRAKVVTFLKGIGYRFYNQSVFQVDNQPAPIRKTFIPGGVELINYQTLVSRVKRDLLYNFLRRRFPNCRLYRNFVYENLVNNNIILKGTRADVKKNSRDPKFVYTHLMMPHYPYYFDRSGKATPYQVLVSDNYRNKKHYIGYLEYCRTTILKLVGDILQNSPAPPVIILMSDHGFRYTRDESWANNFYAVLVPDRKYDCFPDQVLATDQFKLLFRQLWGIREVQ